MADRFNRIDGTAPVIDAAESRDPKVPKSAFDFSRGIAGPVNIGLLYPIECFDTVPNERIDIDIAVALESVNPSVRKLLNGFDCYLHAYYNRESDLWEGSKNFTTKGRSGAISGSIPRVDMSGSTSSPDIPPGGFVSFDTVGSLSDWLGVQPNTEDLGTMATLTSYRPSISVNVKTGHSTYVNAIPFFMYTRLWRDKYAPKNLLQNNKNIFPDNEDHFIIPYEAVRYNIVDYSPDNGSGTKSFSDFVFQNQIDLSAYVGSNSTSASTRLVTTVLRPRQFKGDDFTTSSPFPDLVRGDIPDLSDFISSDSVNVFLEDSSAVFPSSAKTFASNPTVSSPPYNIYQNISTNGYLGTSSPALVVHNTSILSGVTVKSIAALNAYTVFAERMGRTNGDYDEMIKAQFGFDPNNQSREARYLGGFHFKLGNETINQTSESGDTPLGTEVSRTSGAGQGRVASFTSPDFGYVMVLFSFIPDSYYKLGQDSYLSQRYQTDRYFPIFEQLGAQGLPRSELGVTGNATDDEIPFGYVERNYRYKSRRSCVRGALRQSHSVNDEFASRIMSREYGVTGDNRFNLNSLWVSAIEENLDYQIFSSNNDSPFLLAARVDVTRISPMSYTTAPAGFSPATM